jgi:hypothetical protein
MGRKQKKANKIAMSVFRNNQTYNDLLRNFDIAVEKIWPESAAEPNPKCVGISHEPDDLERLTVAAFVLMKYIRQYLKKKRLDYNEQVRFPNLYTALEEAVAITREGRCALSIEAERLEQCSRAAYHWMKTYKMLGRKPTAAELDHKSVKSYCFVCKTEPAIDDSGSLCAECSGYSEPPQTEREKCSVCASPAVDMDSMFCDACGAENRKNAGASRIHSAIGPFDNDGYPLDSPVHSSFGNWREPNDMGDMGDMMFGGRFNKIR